MNGDTSLPTLETFSAPLGPSIENHLETTIRSVVRHASMVASDGYLRVITGEMHPLGNILLGRDASDPRKMEALIEPLCACGAPCAVACTGGRPQADARAIFETHGFVLAETMPAMGIDIDQLADTALAAGYDMVRIDVGTESDKWAETLAVGYEIPRGVAEIFSPNATGMRAASDAATQSFAIRKGDDYVATSLLHLAEELAGIYCVATVPKERGRGLGAYLTAEPLRLARKLGYHIGVLQSSTAGYSVYKRLGFIDYGSVPLYVRMPAAGADTAFQPD